MKKIYLIISLFWLTGCSSFLEEYSQDLAYIQSYEDLDELLLGNAYFERYICYSWQTSGMSGDQYYSWVHVSADELQQINDDFWWGPTGPGWVIFGYYTWQYRVYQDPDGKTSWNENSDFKKLYAHINACNMILAEAEAFDNSGDATVQENIDRIKGECYFLRGSYYFLLANFYGKPYEAATAASDPCVPLKLTNYVEDIHFRRNSVAEVYDQIEKDLLEAERLLKDIPKKSIYRADVHAARLMLSRMYLYKCDYENAMNWSLLVTEEGPILADLNAFTGTEFLNSELSELIFSTGSSSLPGSVTNTKNYFALQGNDFQLSEELYNAYDPQYSHDLRLQHYVSFLNGWYCYKKMQGYSNSLSDLSDVFLLRTSEAYLNLAEAAACAGEEATARTALAALRQRRIDQAYYDPSELNSLTGEELVRFAREERRRELCLEGHRWFDLRRYRVAALYPEEVILEHTHINKAFNESLGMNEVLWTRKYTLVSDDPAWVLPLPQEEIDKNTGMINNPRNERSYENVNE